MTRGWQELIAALAALAFIAAVVAVLGLFMLHRSLRRLQLPPDADLATTLRHVPLSLVVILDLLDFGLDIFATPITWVFLGHYRLSALRNVAAVEDLIPFTQLIPTMTIGWLAVRILNLGRPQAGPTLVDVEPEDRTDRTGLLVGEPPDRPTLVDVEPEDRTYYVSRTGRR